MIRIIGLGSPFGDDRAGWHVIRSLEDRVAAGVDAVALDRPGAALVNWFADVDNVILVDAVAGEGPPGRIIEIDDLATLQLAGSFSSHQLDLAATLKLAQTLGTLPRKLTLYGIAVGQPDLETLRDSVATAAERLAVQLIHQTKAEQAAISG